MIYHPNDALKVKLDNALCSKLSNSTVLHTQAKCRLPLWLSNSDWLRHSKLYLNLCWDYHCVSILKTKKFGSSKTWRTLLLSSLLREENCIYSLFLKNIRKAYISVAFEHYNILFRLQLQVNVAFQSLKECWLRQRQDEEWRKRLRWKGKNSDIVKENISHFTIGAETSLWGGF